MPPSRLNWNLSERKRNAKVLKSCWQLVLSDVHNISFFDSSLFLNKYGVHHVALFSFLTSLKSELSMVMLLVSSLEKSVLLGAGKIGHMVQESET